MWLVPLLFFPFHQQEQQSQAVRPKSQFLHFAQVPFIPSVAWSQFVSNYFWSKSASFPSPGKVSTDHLLLFHLQCKLNLWPATGKEGSLTYSNPAARLLLLHCCCYIVATSLLLHRCCYIVAAPSLLLRIRQKPISSGQPSPPHPLTWFTAGQRWEV